MSGYPPEDPAESARWEAAMVASERPRGAGPEKVHEPLLPSMVELRARVRESRFYGLALAAAAVAVVFAFALEWGYAAALGTVLTVLLVMRAERAGGLADALSVLRVGGLVPAALGEETRTDG